MEDPGIRVYPNPNKGEQIKVEIQDDLSDIRVELYSLHGKNVKTWNLKNSLSINQLELSEVISGSYIMTLATKKWIRQQRIFIVSDWQKNTWNISL